MGYNFIQSNLAMGSFPPVHTPLPFDTIVLCAIELQYPSNVLEVRKVIHAPLDDSLFPITNNEKKIAIHAANQVSNLMCSGRKVLVTCHMGRNRSGLVTALALMNYGMSADRAIQLIRAERGQKTLRNRSFVDFLHSRPYGNVDWAAT